MVLLALWANGLGLGAQGVWPPYRQTWCYSQKKGPSAIFRELLEP